MHRPMILERVTRELEFVLLEAAGRVNLDMDDYETFLKDKIEDLYDWSVNRNGKENVSFDPESEFKWRFTGSLKSMHKLGSGLGRILNKLDIPNVNLTVKPHYDDDQWHQPVRYAYVTLHTGSKSLSGSRGSPGFTYFGPREVDDVLDAGDHDFFADQDVEVAYFKLVNEIRHPGSANKAGKPTRVYTARPVKDRRVYDGAKTVPSGIFVTNSADRAEGFGRDFGNTEGRDLWKIVVDSKYLVQTLKSGRTRDYQIVGKGKVPIKSIERLS